MRDWLSHRVDATPDAEALVSAASGRSWSYDDLDAAVDAMSGRLAGLGVGPGDHLAVVMEPRIEYVTLVHAAMRLGVRLVPVSHKLTAVELRPRLNTAAATLLLCGSDTEQVALEATASETADEDDDTAIPVVSIDEPGAKRVEHLQSADAEEFDPVPWTRGEPVLMLFTSGSTGSPKLVVLTMGNILASAVASAFKIGVDPDSRYMAALGFHHTGGIMPLYRATLYGTTVVLRIGFEPGGVADDIHRHGVTGISLVPTMLRRMLDARGTLAESLRVVLVGGAPASAELVERCRNYSIPVHVTYGMTEAASGITIARPAEAFDREGTVGRPLFWTDLQVCDEDGEVLPAGEVGEFVVDGPTVSPGYYRDREAQRAAFVDGKLRTGDVGYRDERGYCYVLNRTDDRIITGGENVDPGEVLAVLREHPSIEDAAVVGVPDPEWGERVAALVVRSTPSLDADDIATFCRDRLADFKRPRTTEFAEGLPRTDSGTVERPKVRERLAGGDDTGVGDNDGDENEAESTQDDDDGDGTGNDDENVGGSAT